MQKNLYNAKCLLQNVTAGTNLVFSNHFMKIIGLKYEAIYKKHAEFEVPGPSKSLDSATAVCIHISH